MSLISSSSSESSGSVFTLSTSQPSIVCYDQEDPEAPAKVDSSKVDSSKVANANKIKLIDKSLELESVGVDELVVTLASVMLVLLPGDVAPIAEPIVIERNVDCAKRLSDGQLSSKGGRVLSVVLCGVGEDVRVVLQLVLDVPFHQDLWIVSAAIVFTEELLGLQSHEVGGGPLHPAHEHGDPQEEDHLDLPGSKLSNSFENIFVEKLHISG